MTSLATSEAHTPISVVSSISPIKASTLAFTLTLAIDTNKERLH